MTFRFLLAVPLLLPLAVLAIEPYTCRNGAFPTYEELGVAQITAEKRERVHAREDWEGCPDQPTCTAQKGYLVDGDLVLTAHPADGWICIYYMGQKTDYVGWVPQEKVKRLTITGSPSLRAWTGSWRSLGESSISIALGQKGDLDVLGKASWHGGINTYGEEIIHIGEFAGTTIPAGTRMTVPEDEMYCEVNLRLLQPFLITTDNANCGGVNVRFNGIYRRQRDINFEPQ